MTDEVTTLNIDDGDLTLGEIMEIEELTECTFSQIAGNLSGKVIASLVFVITKRDNPEFTWDEALKTKIRDIEFGDGEDEVETDPFEPETSESESVK